MSVKLDLHTDIKQALADNVKEIRTLGLWNNQFSPQNDLREIPYNFPACFIEFSNIAWNTSQVQLPKHGTAATNIHKEQSGEGSTVILHIGFAPLTDEQLSFIRLDPVVDKVYYAIQMLASETYTPLLRTTEIQDTNHGRIIDWQMIFNTRMEQVGIEDRDLRKIAAGTVTLDKVTVDLDIAVGTELGIRTNRKP